MCVRGGGGGGGGRRGGHRSGFLQHKEDSENCSEGRGKLRFRVSITLLKTLAGKLSDASLRSRRFCLSSTQMGG